MKNIKTKKKSIKNKNEEGWLRKNSTKEKETKNWKMDISDFAKNGCLVNSGD